MKRLLAVTVCALMVLAMVAGCAANTSAPAQSSSAPATIAPSDGGTAASTPAPAPTQAELKPLTIDWGMSMSDPSQDSLGKWLQDNFKVTLNVVAIDGEDKINMLAASGTLPDLISGMAFGDATFNQLKSTSMIRTIPDEMLAKYPLVQKTIANHPILSGYNKVIPDNYWLPVYGDADNPPVAQQNPFFYRADWAKKLNIAPPQTVDDFYNMLKAFAFDDPDGDGKNDTYGISGWLWQANFIPWVDMYSWVKEDGKWIPGYLSKNMLSALEFYNKLYKEKILDPEFANADDRSLFFTDKVGVVNMNGSAYWIWKNIYQKFAGAHDGMSVDQAMDIAQFVPPLKADASGSPQWMQQLDCWGLAIGANCSDEKLDRILDIANWELTPAGRDFITYGIEGQDWIEKDGKAVSILPNNPSTGQQKTLNQVYPSISGLVVCEGFSTPGTPWLNPTLPQACLDRSAQWQTMASPDVFKPNFAINYLSTPLRDKMTLSTDTVESDFQNVVASKDVDAAYNTLIKSYMDTQGLQAVIDEVNKAIADQGLDK